MKLVFFTLRGFPHKKNFEGIQLMCKSLNIEFEFTHDKERLKINNYEILYCISDFIDYKIIPERIKIIYGPQFWVIPKPPIVGKFQKELQDRCVFNSLSKWVEIYYLELSSEFIMPISQFPFAVNIEKFSPIEINKEYDCIVYIKRKLNKIVNFALEILNKKNLKYKIFRYGSYNEDDYLNSLRKSKFMLTLDAHESQGFALQEAMSTGVPLLVIDAISLYDETDDGINSTYKYLKPKELKATSVPYWSDECGIKIKNENDLEESLDLMLVNYKNYKPREFIKKELSPDICMKRILNYFNLV
jgi:glycosyltransferase involved in cell wall biosynthesis